MPPSARKRLLASLSDEELRLLRAAWPFWARDDQLPPADSDWTTWLFLGGRGAGKTRAGAEWLKAEIEAGRGQHIALIGETLQDARAVMVEGPTGLLALENWRERPRFFPSVRRIVFGSGAAATLFSSEDPDSLRGYQFDRAWSDELAKWTNPQETWDMLQFGLRLGRRPRQAVTTTPRPIKLLKSLIASPATALTRASSYANRANLAPGFFSHIASQFEGTRLGRQELGGEIIEDNPEALWRGADIEKRRVAAAPELTRIVIGVDPPVSTSETASACGIVVAGRSAEGHAYVLADRSVQGLTPYAWAQRVAASYDEFAADRVIAEVNNGGALVTEMLRTADRALPVTEVHARRGKALRAEPVAALYERGLVHHVGVHDKLEAALTGFVPWRGALKDGQDRLDALVWALTALMLTEPVAEPKLRFL